MIYKATFCNFKENREKRKRNQINKENLFSLKHTKTYINFLYLYKSQDEQKKWCLLLHLQRPRRRRRRRARKMDDDEREASS